MDFRIPPQHLLHGQTFLSAMLLWLRSRPEMFSKPLLVGCQGLGRVGSTAKPFTVACYAIPKRQECG